MLAVCMATKNSVTQRYDLPRGILVELEVRAVDFPLVIREEARTIRVPHVVSGVAG
jgi:hypothetical protein